MLAQVTVSSDALRNKKEYEVRSNLKNFTEVENAELYCVRFHVVQVRFANDAHASGKDDI